jgi:hypothetical protein
LSFETDLLSGLGIWILALSPLGFMITAIVMARLVKAQAQAVAQPVFVEPPVVFGGGRELDVALGDALRLNSVSARVSSSPISYLQGSTKYAPRKYQSAVAEIASKLREGQIINLDLGQMGKGDAARLVDFCSGTIAMSGGWIFQPAGMVIILVPGRND